MAAVVVGIGMIAATTVDARRASACDVVSVRGVDMGELVAWTPVIAIGRWANATSFEVTLVVEESIKGTKAGERFALDNRNDSPTRGCAAVDAQQGPRFANGERAIVFLEPVDGQWRIAVAGSAVDEAPRDARVPVLLSRTVTVRDIRALADEGGDKAEWFVPVMTVALVVAAGATAVGGVRAGVRR